MAVSADTVPAGLSRITLVVPATGDAVRVSTFARRVADRFPGRVLRTVGSWNQTVITMESAEVSPDNFLEGLSGLPDIQRAEETRRKEVKGTVYQDITVTLAADPNSDRAPRELAAGASASPAAWASFCAPGRRDNLTLGALATNMAPCSCGWRRAFFLHSPASFLSHGGDRPVPAGPAPRASTAPRAASAYDRISRWPQFKFLRRLIVRELKDHHPRARSLTSAAGQATWYSSSQGLSPDSG